PGTVPAYSNYGATLAGYIVQRVSGVPFEKYIDENIFKPLGMTHSSFAQPLPKELAPLMSAGYMRGSEEAKPFEMVAPFPAGSLASSAGDMTRFIIAHLNNGQFENERILKSETATLMHTRQFGLDPALNGMACGFYEESRNGHRIIGHGGDTVYFHSDLHLVLDAGVGFFVSYNSAGRGQGNLRSQLWYAFLDRYFPFTPPSEPAVSTAKADADIVAGKYIVSRREDTSFLKPLYLLSEFTVDKKDDGTIQVDQITGFNGQPKTWREIGPLKYREVDGQDMLAFKRDHDRLMLALDIPIEAGQRVGASENGGLVLPVVVIALAIMLLTLVLWPIGWLVRRHYGKPLASNPQEKRLRVVTRLVLVLDLVFFVGLICIIAYGFEHLWVLNERLDTWIHLSQVIGVIGAVGTVAIGLNTIVSWVSKRKGIWTKLGDTVIFFACLVFVWFAVTQHLLNFTLRY
ncbi:MAG: serine hydrolase domain-containing protein, partial [Blastocatellia bacterium]